MLIVDIGMFYLFPISFPLAPLQIRLLFLLHKYNTPMDYGDDAMSGALGAEKIFNEFFHNVKAALRSSTSKVGSTFSVEFDVIRMPWFAVCSRSRFSLAGVASDWMSGSHQT